jgi:hypothetical protein
MKKLLTLDVECYRNYFLVLLKHHETGKTVGYEMFNDEVAESARKKLHTTLKNNTVITFNGLNYDMPMVSGFLAGYTNAQLKTLSDKIITGNLNRWMTYKKFGLRDYKFDHIDVREPTIGVQVSLKVYGGRLGMPKLQDLPIAPDAVITPEQVSLMRQYCENDLDTTWALYDVQKGSFKLREDVGAMYGLDLRSRSDAQIAEDIFKSELTKLGVEVYRPDYPENYSFKYQMPDWINFTSPELEEVKQRVIDATFTLSDAKQPVLPLELNRVIKFRGAKYKFGIGGLHSQEKAQRVICDDDHMLFDADVASMYPSIILGQNLHPKHLGEGFLKVYRGFYTKRLKAKRDGDALINSTYKIVLNGSYGKFGSPYSVLYSPNLLIQTTITGQLTLLMVIEMLTDIDGVKVWSANTDGVVVHAHKDKMAEIQAALFGWEMQTGLELEETTYKAVYWRDVNNYIAVKDKGVKGKGVFTETGLGKSPKNPVCYKAVIAYLAEGVPVEQTLKAETDITKFLTVRTVKGGGVWKDQYLGKAVRWYYTNQDGESIHYKSNGNKVPDSDGAKACMDLPDEFPSDLDYDRYVQECVKILGMMGIEYDNNSL